MFCSSASTVRLSAFCARGGGAMRPMASSRSPTPKFFSAEPKNTGLRWPSRNVVRSNGLQASRTSPISSAIASASRLGLSAATSLMLISRKVPARPASPSSRRTPPPSTAMVPTKSRPRPTGQFTGVVSSASVFSISSSRSNGSRRLAVELVDEGDDRDVAQPADLEQLPGARLDALGGVDHHHRGIDRGQRAVGVLGEVLVARRVEQVEDQVVVFEGHHRGDDRDAALALDRHPVGLGRAAVALGLDVAGELDRAAEQQQLLGQRGLAGVRMRDDGEGAPALDLGGQRRTVVAHTGICTGRPDGNVHAGVFTDSAPNSRRMLRVYSRNAGSKPSSRRAFSIGKLAVVLGDVVDARRAARERKQRRMGRGAGRERPRSCPAGRTRCRGHRAGRSAGRCRRCPAFSARRPPAPPPRTIVRRWASLSSSGSSSRCGFRPGA